MADRQNDNPVAEKSHPPLPELRSTSKKSSLLTLFMQIR